MSYDAICRKCSAKEQAQKQKAGRWLAVARAGEGVEAEELLRVSCKPDCADGCPALEVYLKKQQIIHSQWVNLMGRILYFNKAEKGRYR